MTNVNRRLFTFRLLPALGGLLVADHVAAQSVSLPGAIRRRRREPEATRLRVQLVGGDVRELDLDDYVAGSLLEEAALGGLDPTAARIVAEVQAIVARTYALANLGRHAGEGFDLCATTHCQVYRDDTRWPAELVRTAQAATRNTRGVVIAHGGKPINAVFHAACGGRTSDARNVWNGRNPPYLRGLPDTFCAEAQTRPWRARIDLPELRRLLNDNSVTRVGGRLDRVDITRRDAAGRAVRVALRGARSVEVSGTALRSTLNSGLVKQSLRSTQFDVRREGRTLLFEGTGHGHGVGLCQVGATARACSGHAPEDIIAHYYPDTQIVGTGDLARA